MKNKVKKLLNKMFNKEQKKSPPLQYKIFPHFIRGEENTYLQMLQQFEVDAICDKFNKEKFPHFMWVDRGESRDGYIGNNSNYKEFWEYLQSLFPLNTLGTNISLISDEYVWVSKIWSNLYDRSSYSFNIEFDYMLISNDEDINYIIIRTGEKDNILRMFKYSSIYAGCPVIPIEQELEGISDLENTISTNTLYGKWIMEYTWEDGEKIGLECEELTIEQLKKYYEFYEDTKDYLQTYSQFVEWRLTK